MTKYQKQRRALRSEPASDYIQIRCRPEDKRRWKAQASRQGLGLGTFIKFLLNKEQ